MKRSGYDPRCLQGEGEFACFLVASLLVLAFILWPRWRAAGGER